ncbi:nose resistant to fluoxetine protein 6-like isoform X1 [Adelges cooleyi]|uniref:nose resistant to fluoxetine protein 6-like isoform X1 n=1 Tax=Adelges cooleyi TaxID=133065 RepID=UPI00217F3D76|nr:nose resistant to fluoxetine protein 6-like isoform X1 [Adelges cooleyi]
MFRAWALLAFIFPVVIFSNEIAFNSQNVSTDTKNIILPNTINSKLDDSIATGLEPVYPESWLANLFYQSLVGFSVTDVGNSACRLQSELYLSHLKNNSYWAVKMADSWPRYLNGLLIGNTHHIGVYDECISVHQPIQGKYCLSNIELRTSTDQNFTQYSKDKYTSFDNAWQEILGFIDYGDRYKRNVIKLGVCIPEACTSEDLEVSLQRELDRIFQAHQLTTQVKVKPEFCSTNISFFPYDTGYYVTCIIIGLLILVVSFSTVYHLVACCNGRENKPWHVFSAQILEITNIFSVITNGKDLYKFDKNNELSILNGVSSLLMMITIMSHEWMISIFGPYLYPKPIEEFYQDAHYNLFLSVNNGIDYFLFISGYILYTIMITKFRKPECNWFQIPKIIIYKYLKSLPGHVTMILLTIFIIPHMGNGPFWANQIGLDANKCKQYWWTNLLVINNFIEGGKQCLFAGYYISLQLQLIVIGMIVVYIYGKNRKIGTGVLALLISASLIIPFALTYYSKSEGITKFNISFFLNLSESTTSNSFHFTHLYTQLYVRGLPFYIGLLAGIIVEVLKKNDIKMSKTTTLITTMVAFGLYMYVQLYSNVFYQRHRDYNAIESSIYAAIGHLNTPLFLMWCAICHTTSSYGFLEKLLNNRFSNSLHKLSYSIYLVNFPIIIMIVFSARTSEVLTSGMIIMKCIYIILTSLLAALIMHLFVDAPFGLLINRVLLGRSSRKVKDD